MMHKPNKNCRIIFAGSSDFAVPALKSLLSQSYKIVAVLTQPDRRAGRGRILKPNPVKDFADKRGLSVFHPVNLDDKKLQKSLASLNADLMIVAAYGLMVSEGILALPRLGCVNLHASILPRWRGASPIQAAILNGDSYSGVSLMQMDAGLDTGPLLSKVKLSILPEETGGELQNRLAKLASQLLMENIQDLISSSLEPIPQLSEHATYAGKINKRDGLINWSQSAIEIHHQILAYNPWPVAYTLFEGKILRCWAATVIESDQTTNSLLPGEVLVQSSKGILVATGEGVISLIEVQLPGRKRLSALQFNNAHDLIGYRLG
ncbi:MAG: methionyl-tRNA formyltransferase [Pseudomonadota bacterium]|nr:methionyl-tRNA formyltransferase [Pseudomonadota bacterium]